MRVRALPASTMLPVLSIVSVLAPTVEVMDTTAELLIVKLLIVAEVLKSMAASISMTTSCAFVGTALNDQLPAVDQALSPAVPVQVLVVCPSAPGAKAILPIMINQAYNVVRPVELRKKQVIKKLMVFIGVDIE